MTNSINVFLAEDLVGRLSVDKYGTLSFSYDDDYVEKGGKPLSLSLPLTDQEYYGGAAHAYFTGLLPEEAEKASIARAINISTSNHFHLLSELGKECIGAVRITESLPQERWSFAKLTENELYVLLTKDRLLQPYLHSEKNVRLSIAGAQPKTALYLERGTYFLPKNGAPSNVILKPDSVTYGQLPFNEYATMILAEKTGIAIPQIRLIKINGATGYVVDRYDREWGKSGPERIHQEDFSQALCVMHSAKYEKEGGPGFVRCLRLIRDRFLVPALDIEKFTRIFLFNVLIGNCDAHAKNYSIIHDSMGPRLASGYDLVCTSMYPELSTDLAMSVNGKFDVDQIQREDWIAMAYDAEISGTALVNRLEEMASQILVLLNGILSRPEFQDVPDFNEKYSNSVRDNIRRLFGLTDLNGPIGFAN